MTQLIPYDAGESHSLAPANRKGQKSLNRTLSSIQRSKTIGLARIEQEAELQSAKAHAIGFVGQQAMQAVTMVSQMEGQLAQACPLATTRLQGIADMTALSLAQVVSDSVWKIGR